jgi:hypothetical protein
MNFKIFIIALALVLAGCGKESQPTTPQGTKPSKLEEERQRNMEIANSAPVEEQKTQLFLYGEKSEGNVNPVLEKNKEYSCMTIEVKFVKNGTVVNQMPAPQNTQPVKYRHDGNSLNAWYENGASVALNQAALVKSERVSDQGKFYDVMTFGKTTTSMANRVDFIREVGGGAGLIMEIIRFSDNGFSSYGEYLGRCS